MEHAGSIVSFQIMDFTFFWIYELGDSIKISRCSINKSPTFLHKSI